MDAQLRKGDAVIAVDMRRKDNIPGVRRKVRRGAPEGDKLHLHSRIIAKDATGMNGTSGLASLGNDVPSQKNWFRIAVTEGLEHLQLLKKDIIEFMEGHFAADIQQRLHGLDPQYFLNRYIKLSTELLEVFFLERKPGCHGMTAETDQ